MKSQNVRTILLFAFIIVSLIVAAYLNSLELGISPRVLRFIALPGDMFFDFLQLLYLPLTVTSLITSVSRMKAQTSLLAITWILTWSLASAILSAIFSVLWSIALMGTFTPWIVMGSLMKPVLWKSSDIVYDLLRNMVPSHFLVDSFQQHKTDITSTASPQALVLRSVKIDEPNVMGILFGCCIVGLTMSRIPRETVYLTNLLSIINDAAMKMSEIALWLAPLCSASIIVEDILSSNVAMKHLMSEILFLIQVNFFGLFVYATHVLGFMILIVNRENPLRIMVKSREAVIAAFATSSSAATLPYTIQCVILCGVDVNVSHFMCTTGCSLNKNGTCFYIVVMAFWSITKNNLNITFSLVVTICVNSVFASILVASVPNSGLIGVEIVFRAASLTSEGMEYVMVVNWLLDRFTTMVNVFGDCVLANMAEHKLNKGERKRSDLLIP